MYRLYDWGKISKQHTREREGKRERDRGERERGRERGERRGEEGRGCSYIIKVHIHGRQGVV